MAGVQAIIDRIITDAKKQADSIAETARREAAENGQKAARETKAQVAEILKKAELDSQEEQRRARAIDDLESRKGALREKRQAIAQAFDLARQKILGLDEAAYDRFLFSLLAQCGQEGGGVWVSEKDKRFFTDEFFARAKKEISTGLSLGGTSDSIETGFLLKSGDAEINCSIAFVLKQAREKLEGDTARILFGEGD